MNANFASIMPQVIGVWCKEEGHDVNYHCYTGLGDIRSELPADLDIVFIGAFTEAAQMAYALSAYYQSKGIVTVLGGPHARCYPQDAQLYFDYILGFTDKTVIHDVLTDCSHHRPLGRCVSAAQQPQELPGVRERWQFLGPVLKRAPIIKMVPMLGSIGCPYTCSFCIDSEVPYQQLNLEVMKEDLRFLRTQFKRPLVGWHDPNFGVRFDEFLDAIEDAIPPDSIDFIAESTLSLLSEPRLIRMKKNGFKGLLPGIESWYGLGDKSHTGRTQGMDKVKMVADHVNMIMRYIPYLQANFVMGLDTDMGAEPFELTKKFIDLAPGAFPAYSLLSAFGQAAPLNLEYQREGRVIPFPFHFLNNHGAMNIKPKNYEWPEFYGHVIDLTRHSFSKRAIYRRARATNVMTAKWLNVVRAMSSEGYGRIKYFNEVKHNLETDPSFRAFFEHKSSEVPAFFTNLVRKDLGEFWDWLPKGAMNHDPNAYLKSQVSTHFHVTHHNGAGKAQHHPALVAIETN